MAINESKSTGKTQVLRRGKSDGQLDFPNLPGMSEAGLMKYQTFHPAYTIKKKWLVGRNDMGVWLLYILHGRRWSLGHALHNHRKGLPRWSGEKNFGLRLLADKLGWEAAMGQMMHHPQWEGWGRKGKKMCLPLLCLLTRPRSHQIFCRILKRIISTMEGDKILRPVYWLQCIALLWIHLSQLSPSCYFSIWSSDEFWIPLQMRHILKIWMVSRKMEIVWSWWWRQKGDTTSCSQARQILDRGILTDVCDEARGICCLILLTRLGII